GTILTSFSSDIQVLPISAIDFAGDIEENGTSFAENSLIKALVPAGMGYIGMADDSGLTVDALDGAPGIYSARYAGEHGDDKANRDLLLANLKDVPAEARGGAFVCVITMVFPESAGMTVPEAYRIDAELAEKYGVDPARVLSIRGESRGVIGYEEKGEGGFGYDCLFCCPDYENRTFAEISQEEKNAVSHRGRAMETLRHALAEMHLGE
ncbi:MAG: hypothetical protein IKY52_13865, partial [Clostridia bacterium]|nr:hypothetical protein [Clostridia bacterium]